MVLYFKNHIFIPKLDVSIQKWWRANSCYDYCQGLKGCISQNTYPFSCRSCIISSCRGRRREREREGEGKEKQGRGEGGEGKRWEEGEGEEEKRREGEKEKQREGEEEERRGKERRGGKEESLIELEFVGSSTYYEAYQHKQPNGPYGQGTWI